MEPIDVTELRWLWGQALAGLPADAPESLNTFMRETVPQLLDAVDERNKAAAKIAEAAAVLGG